MTPACPTYVSLLREEIFDEFDTDFTGKMGGEEFNWAYATLQLKVKDTTRDVGMGQIKPPGTADVGPCFLVPGQPILGTYF